MHTTMAPNERSTHILACDLWCLQGPGHLAHPTPYMLVQMALAHQWLQMVEPLIHSSLE